MSKVCSSRWFDQYRKLAGGRGGGGKALSEVVSVSVYRNQMSSATKVSAEQMEQGKWVEDSTGRVTSQDGICAHQSGMEKPYHLCGAGNGNRKPLGLRKA